MQRTIHVVVISLGMLLSNYALAEANSDIGKAETRIDACARAKTSASILCLRKEISRYSECDCDENYSEGDPPSAKYGPKWTCEVTAYCKDADGETNTP